MVMFATPDVIIGRYDLFAQITTDLLGCTEIVVGEISPHSIYCTDANGACAFDMI